MGLDALAFLVSTTILSLKGEGIAIIKDAFSKGFTFFDTTNVYGANTNEVLVGKVCISIIF